MTHSGTVTMSSVDRNTGKESGGRQRNTSGAKPRRRCSRVSLKVTRPVYTESEFQKGYKHSENNQFPLVQIQDKVRDLKCRLRLKDLQNFIVKLVPIISWLPGYSVREDFFRDVIAGCTIGVMRIPQAMAYALLATLPAVYGLYVAFYPTLIYAILGTSRHISIGTFAVVSIMAGNAIDTFLSNGDSSVESTESPITEATAEPPNEEPDKDMERVQVAMALCLLVGIIQLVMGILRLGFVTIYLSEPLVRGFTTGAAAHVFNSQFKGLFGITVPRFSGALSIVKSYIHFFSNLAQTNPTTLVISLISITVLMGASEILDYHANRGLCNRSGNAEEDGQPAKERKPRKKLPIPTELFVIIIATAVSYVGKFEEEYGVAVVGNIPTGLPVPIVPHFSYLGRLFPDAIAISIVAFAISVSMASLMANRNNYAVDSNQELLAYGSCGIVSSFFHCFPHAASLSRSVVQESSGGKTQVAGLVSSALVLVVLLVLGRLFTQLPVACLAAVIVVALRGMFRQFKDLLVLWKVSMIDLSIWIVSFLAVVLIGVDLGLLVAVLYSLITVIVRTQQPDCVLMGKIPGTDIYRDIAVIEAAEELAGIKIFRASSSLCFVNAEHFRSSLYSKVGIDPQKELTKESKRQGCTCMCVRAKTNNGADDADEIPDITGGPSKQVLAVTVRDVHTVVIDCSMFSFVDVVGIKTLQTIVADYKKIGIRVVFANCKAPIRHSMMQSSKLSKQHIIDLGHMYVSVHDAVLHFHTPNCSPSEEWCTCMDCTCMTKSSRSTSVTYDFDPIAIAAANQTLTPSTIAATLKEHEESHDGRPHSSTTVMTELEESHDGRPHSSTTGMTELEESHDGRPHSSTTVMTKVEEENVGIHQVQLHNHNGKDHHDNKNQKNDRHANGHHNKDHINIGYEHDIGTEIGLNAEDTYM